MKRSFISLIAMVFLTGCGGGGGDASTASSKPAASATKPVQAANTAKPGGDKGIGPVEHVDIASLDKSRAELGKEKFETLCSACHKVDERYIGPALAGVTERRKPEWIMNMIMNPDQMVKEDPTAKALFAEYLAPMTNQNVSREDAEAILSFFLHNDHEAHEDAEEEHEDQ